MWCSNHAPTLQLLALLLIFTSQTLGQVTEEICSAKHYGGTYVSYISCPPGSDVRKSNVWFKFNEKGDSLVITCNKNSSAEQLESYLASVPRMKKESVNLTHLKLTGCPAPGGSESFGTWLTLLGSQVGNLRYLQLISTKETILKSEHFAGLDLLTAVEVSGSVETLGPKLLSNLISLEEFKCSRNQKGTKLTSVHELAFSQNKKLRTIRISNSMVSTIHKDTFKGLANLEILDLGFNMITSIPGDLLIDLHGLRTLILRHNSIPELPQNLLLKNHNLTTFSVQHQRLQGGGIIKIPAKLFQKSTNLENLRFQGNSLHTLPTGLFRGLQNLRSLDLSENSLNISLPTGLFRGLQNLRSLELNENSLNNTAIAGEMLKDLNSLEEINLSRNQFTSPLTDHLHSLKDTLKKINLNQNLLSTFESDWATEFKSLLKINLQNNNLKGTLHQQDFLFKAAGVVRVNLQDNQIERLVLDQKSDSCVSTTAQLNLKNNMIACDCFAYELLPKQDSCILVESFECPEKGTQLRFASPDSLTCQIECDDVMPNAFFNTCQCSYVPAHHSAVVDCSHRDVPLVGEKTENLAKKVKDIKVILQYNNLTELHSSMWKVADNTSAKITHIDASKNRIDKILPEHLPENLSKLDMSKNRIFKILPEHLPENLSELFLDNNLITEFDEDTLKHLNNSLDFPFLKLGGNKFACDCRSLKLIEFLRKHISKILDRKDIRFDCAPKELPFRWGLETEDWVCPDLGRSVSWTYLILGFLLLCAVLVGLMARFRVRAKKGVGNIESQVASAEPGEGSPQLHQPVSRQNSMSETVSSADYLTAEEEPLDLLQREGFLQVQQVIRQNSTAETISADYLSAEEESFDSVFWGDHPLLQLVSRQNNSMTETVSEDYVSAEDEELVPEEGYPETVSSENHSADSFEAVGAGAPLLQQLTTTADTGERADSFLYDAFISYAKEDEQWVLVSERRIMMRKHLSFFFW